MNFNQFRTINPVSDNETGSNSASNSVSESASLGIHTEFSAAPPQSEQLTPAVGDKLQSEDGYQEIGDSLYMVNKARRFYHQSLMRNLLNNNRSADDKPERMTACMRIIAPHKLNVEMHRDRATMRVKGKNFIRCSSPRCPVCGPVIAHHRGNELRLAVANWQNSGGVVLMVTLTISHHRGESLEVVGERFRQAWSFMNNHRRWKGKNGLKATYAIRHNTRTPEETNTDANGWHVHAHVLLLLDVMPPDDELDEQLTDLWLYCVDKAGGYADREHGCNIIYANENIAQYVAKWGKLPIEHEWDAADEVTKQQNKTSSKGGKTPTQLLEAYGNGDEHAGKLWVEWFHYARGKSTLQWSKGAKAALGLDELSETDAEIIARSEDEPNFELFAIISPAHWKEIRFNLGRRVHLYRLVHRGDKDKLFQWLETIVPSDMPAAAQPVTEPDPAIRPQPVTDNQSPRTPRDTKPPAPGYVFVGNPDNLLVSSYASVTKDHGRASPARKAESPDATH